MCWNWWCVKDNPRFKAATFGWLCVETINKICLKKKTIGSHLRAAVCWNVFRFCDPVVLGRSHLRVAVCWNINLFDESERPFWQPPSGGCVLKQPMNTWSNLPMAAATFGWLCVETANNARYRSVCYAATFGWLCVETDEDIERILYVSGQPPSGGCVLKPRWIRWCNYCWWAATFGWLCVETKSSKLTFGDDWQPPSGGCVLKLNWCV